MKRLGLAVAVAAALAGLYLLRHEHLIALGFWGADSGLNGVPLLIQLGALVTTPLVLPLVSPSLARTLILVEGLVCLGAYGIPGALYAVALALVWLLFELPAPKAVRPWLVLSVLIAMPLAASRLGPAWHEVAYTFAMLFSLRLIVYAWEQWQTDFPRGEPGRFALYVLSPPLLVLPPYIAIIPFYRRHFAQWTPGPTQGRALLKHLGLALVWTGVVLGLERLRPWLSRVDFDPLDVIHGFILLVGRIARLAHLVQALLYWHGFSDRAPIDKPLIARSYVEFWTRFQIHQKDVQVALFYNPTMLAFRKRNRYLAIIAAAAVTLFIGNLALHFVARYAWEGSAWLSRLPNLSAFYGLGFAVLAANLCLLEWRARHKRKPPTGAFGVIYSAVTWLMTFLFTAYLEIV
jgi:hypothetical protein